jgi:hypothetical protein
MRITSTASRIPGLVRGIGKGLARALQAAMAPRTPGLAYLCHLSRFREAQFALAQASAASGDLAGARHHARQALLHYQRARGAGDRLLSWSSGPAPRNPAA